MKLSAVIADEHGMFGDCVIMPIPDSDTAVMDTKWFLRPIIDEYNRKIDI